MSKQEDSAIKFSHVSKSFNLPHEKNTSIKSVIIHPFKKRSFEKQEVLKDIDFEIKKGEFFGIVGRNGSGKSTLLKLVAGIYSPDKGAIQVNGKLTPFIELGVGFSPELTGRENVFLNGALLGFNRKEMLAMYDEIVEFAELEKFMDQKLKNYSSGMQVRLAFSIAIRADTEILILDEVLAVGDAAFQQKCFDYFATLKDRKKTVVLVSHSMASVERFCSRALLLEGGKVVSLGKSSDIALMYERLFLDTKSVTGKKADVTGGPIEVKVDIVKDGKKIKGVESGDKFEIRIVATSSVNIKELNVGINIRDSQDRIVFSTDMRRHCGVINTKKNKSLSLGFRLDNYYTNGAYTVDVFFVDEAGIAGKLLSKYKSIASFNVVGVREHIHSLFHPPVEVLVYEK